MLGHRLALRLGGTVRELMARIDAEEWARWQAFDALSPVGDERGDLVGGVVASAVVNSSGFREKDARAVSPADMMPDHGGMRGELEARRMRSAAYRAKKLREAIREIRGG